METNGSIVALRPDQDDGHGNIGGAPPVVSSMHRFASYRSGAVEAETLATACVLVGMLCIACLLFAGCFDASLFA